MRYVALAALVVLVGGYVVGQQPSRTPAPADQHVEPLKGELGERVEDGLPDGKARTWFTVEAGLQPTSDGREVLFTTVEPRANPVGRYVPFGNDRLLDTTNGSLYRIGGHAWVEVVKMPQKAAVTQPPVDEPQYEIVDDPDAK